MWHWQSDLYSETHGGWATDRLFDRADKMVPAAPYRCCVVVGAGRSCRICAEREALDLERETMAAAESIYHLWRRTTMTSTWSSSARFSTRR